MVCHFRFCKTQRKQNVFERRPEENLVKVYSKSGEEKQFDKTIEIEVNDIILTRTDKEIKYSFNIYQIVTRHHRILR